MEYVVLIVPGLAAIGTRDTLHPAFVAFTGRSSRTACWSTTYPTGSMRPAGRGNVGSAGRRSKAIIPLGAPIAEARTEILQTLEREQVGGQRHNDEIGGNDGGSIDRAEVRPYVDQANVRLSLIGRTDDNSVESGGDTESIFFPVQTSRPRIGQHIFEGRKTQIADNQAEPVGDAFDPRSRDITNATKHGVNAPHNTELMLTIGPQFL